VERLDRRRSDGRRDDFFALFFYESNAGSHLRYPEGERTATGTLTAHLQTPTAGFVQHLCEWPTDVRPQMPVPRVSGIAERRAQGDPIRSKLSEVDLALVSKIMASG
jgi:hypothetical protein